MATKYLVALSLAACFLSVARATVTFDVATGTGFVGKGDVQVFERTSYSSQCDVSIPIAAFMVAM